MTDFPPDAEQIDGDAGDAEARAIGSESGNKKQTILFDLVGRAVILTIG